MRLLFPLFAMVGILAFAPDASAQSIGTGTLTTALTNVPGMQQGMTFSVVVYKSPPLDPLVYINGVSMADCDVFIGTQHMVVRCGELWTSFLMSVTWSGPGS